MAMPGPGLLYYTNSSTKNENIVTELWHQSLSIWTKTVSGALHNHQTITRWQHTVHNGDKYFCQRSWSHSILTFLNEHTVPQSPSTELPACQIEWRTHYNLRKDIKRKRTLTFRHCPNHPTPLWTFCDGPETCVEFSCGFSVSLLWWMLYHNLTSVTDQPTYLRTYMGRW